MRQLHALGVAIAQITQNGTAPGVLVVRQSRHNGQYEVDRWAPAGIGKNPTDVPPVAKLVVKKANGYPSGRWVVERGHINLD